MVMYEDVAAANIYQNLRSPADIVYVLIGTLFT